jgi:transmembrane sensor
VDLEPRLREGPLRIRDVWSADKSAQLASKVVRLRRKRSLARAGVALGAALGALAGLIFAHGSFGGIAPAYESGALARLPVTAARRSAGDQVLVLNDGSRAEPADADSHLTVERDRPEHVSVRLSRGSARFAVVRNPARRFEVESGPVLVRVVGTTFTVTRTVDGARVAVDDGRVHVYWAGEETVLTAGESGVFPQPDLSAAVDLPKPRAAQEAAPTASASGWRDLARRGEYRKAYSALHREVTRVRDVPEDRMLAADVARLSGHPEQAVPHLRAVCDRFASDPRAPVAAFTLGRVLLRELGRPREAAAAFLRARTLWPRGPLALDAWASEAEARLAAGDAHAARQLAARYVQRHPDGRHAPAMRALIGSDNRGTAPALRGGAPYRGTAPALRGGAPF